MERAPKLSRAAWQGATEYARQTGQRLYRSCFGYGLQIAAEFAVVELPRHLCLILALEKRKFLRRDGAHKIEQRGAAKNIQPTMTSFDRRHNMQYSLDNCSNRFTSKKKEE